MVNLNYSKYDVLAIFRKDSSGTLNPAASQIAQFDADLFSQNDDLLLQIMGQEGVPSDKSTKSTILLYSRFGAGEINQRIRSACRYFKNTQNL